MLWKNILSPSYRHRFGWLKITKTSKTTFNIDQPRFNNLLPAARYGPIKTFDFWDVQRLQGRRRHLHTDHQSKFDL